MDQQIMPLGDSPLFKDLMSHILLFIEDRASQASLRATSKKLNEMVQPKFEARFRILDLRGWDYAHIKKFLQGLQRCPELSSLVIELRIEVAAHRNCLFPEPCIECVDRDGVVGGALVEMMNLKSLDLENELYTDIAAGLDSKVVGNQQSVLPHLENLFYRGWASDTTLMLAHPIKRLYTHQFVANNTLFHFLADHELQAKSITHIVIQDFKIEGFQLCPFVNLSHFGCIPISVLKGFLGMVTKHRPLLSIKSMDIQCGPKDLPLTGADCIGIRLKLTKLVKIFVYDQPSDLGPTYSLWEYTSDVWVLKPVRQFTSWNIICGEFDNM